MLLFWPAVDVAPKVPPRLAGGSRFADIAEMFKDGLSEPGKPPYGLLAAPIAWSVIKLLDLFRSDPGGGAFVRAPVIIAGG